MTMYFAEAHTCIHSTFATSTNFTLAVISGSTVRTTWTICSGLDHLLVLSLVRQVHESSHRWRVSATIAASAAFFVGYGPDAENWPRDIPGVSVSITQNCEQVADGQSPPAFFLAGRFGFVGVGFFFMVLGCLWGCHR